MRELSAPCRHSEKGWGAAQHAKGSAHFHTGQALRCFSSNKHQTPLSLPRARPVQQALI